MKSFICTFLWYLTTALVAVSLFDLHGAWLFLAGWVSAIVWDAISPAFKS